MQKMSLKDIIADLEGRDNFVFLETKRITGDDYKSYLFTAPKDIICCKDPLKLKTSLDSVDTSCRRGYLAAGFLSYEAGFGLEEALSPKTGDDFPLIWFGIYEDATVFNHKKVRFHDDTPAGNSSLADLNLRVCEEEYISAIKKIKSYIEEGYTYQVNYTIKLDFSFTGSIFDLYLRLRRNQAVSYSAIMRFGDNYILSFSPELFYRKERYSLQVKPMKGTADRGRYMQEDIVNRNLLHLCPKNRSENIMIVDLLRNDLGKISKTNTVKTKNLFNVEGYESLLQMTSTVDARMQEDISLYEIFKAIFPSGSVTGAPKIRTMQIIDELEKEPRRIYTGSIGFISKDLSVFNVAIRTLLIDGKNRRGEMGIGSGVVYDSDPQKEYDECKLKAKFLTEDIPEFQLIETILWEPGDRYPFLKFHLQRLAESAAYFHFIYDEGKILDLLGSTSLNFTDNKIYRVRFLLNKHGDIDITYTCLEDDMEDKLITFSDQKTCSSDRFLFHKTTNRNLYDMEHKTYKEKGFYDIIFQNEKGQITEGAISNIFIRKGRTYYTPPIECGLLNGVYRRYILENGTFPAVENVLYLEDVENADEIILTNAVRKAVKVKLLKKGSLVYA